MKNNFKDNNVFPYEKVIFCTECGDELENISLFNNFNGNLNIVRKNFSRCKKTGKYKGEFCSKLFIFCDDNLEDLFI